MHAHDGDRIGRQVGLYLIRGGFALHILLYHRDEVRDGEQRIAMRSGEHVDHGLGDIVVYAVPDEDVGQELGYPASLGIELPPLCGYIRGDPVVVPACSIAFRQRVALIDHYGDVSPGVEGVVDVSEPRQDELRLPRAHQLDLAVEIGRDALRRQFIDDRPATARRTA